MVWRGSYNYEIINSILLPALLGYIDRAKDQQYIVEARELMTATQAAIVEAYALHDEKVINRPMRK